MFPKSEIITILTVIDLMELAILLLLMCFRVYKYDSFQGDCDTLRQNIHQLFSQNDLVTLLREIFDRYYGPLRQFIASKITKRQKRSSICSFYGQEWRSSHMCSNPIQWLLEWSSS